MSGLRTIGLVACVGLAAGAGGFGLLRYAAAESGDVWKASAKPVDDPAFQPAAATDPFTQPPMLPSPERPAPKAPDLKAGLVVPPPIQIAPPSPPVKSVEPVVLPRPAEPENRLQSATPRHNEKAAEPAPPAVPPPFAVGIVPVVIPPAPAVLPPGDTPMPLSTRHAVLSALFGVAVLTVPPAVVAQDGGKKDDKSSPGLVVPTVVTRSEFDDLKKSMDALKLSLSSLTEKLEGRDAGTAGDGLLNAVRKLSADFVALDLRVKEIEKKQTELRTAGSSPVGDKPAANRATVRVVNEYPTQITMVVNGTPHRVEAASTKDIPVASGTFLYQLLTSGQNEVSSPVKEGEVLTLRVK